jgi:hypothetical protein
MDYLLIAIGGFLFGVYVQNLLGRGSAARRVELPAHGAARQAAAFLRGLKAFEKGVAAQIERDRRSARMRRWVGSRPRIH